MNFQEAYSELKEEFRARVDADHQQWKFESVHLPNTAPNGPVDYILVAMEPSLKGWAKDTADARERIDLGFRNFCGVWQLHFPVSKYLCKDGETCYLTDLAKGAMATVSPGLDFTQNPGKVMDDITFVRSHWRLVSEGFSLSTANSDVQKLPATLYHRIADSLAYAA